MTNSGITSSVEIIELRKWIEGQDRAFVAQLRAAILRGLETPAGVLGHQRHGPSLQERKEERTASQAIRDLGENAREATHRAEEAARTTVRGLREHQLKLVSGAQENVNAVFEFARDALQAQSVHDLIEVFTLHSQRQLAMMAEQSRDLAASAQRIALDTARPVGRLFAGATGRTT
jgi:Phasin protein